MYSKSWLYFIAFVLLLGAILREEALIIVGVLAGLALGMAWLWNRYVLLDVQYERVFSQTRAFPGEPVDVSVRVTNRKLLPLPWLEIADQFPTHLPLSKGRLQVTSTPTVGMLSHMVALRWYERVSWRHQITATSRGYYPFGPLTLRSGDMFGVFSAEERRDEQSFLIVYPRLFSLQRLGLPAKQPFGEVRSPQRIFEDPSRTTGIRDYHVEDGLKRIHWKATARRQQLQSRVYEPTATPQLAVFLNVSTSEHFWQGIESDVLEAAISVAGSLAQYALSEGYATGLFANAPLVQGDQTIRVRPSSSPQQLTKILEALAKLNVFALQTIEETIEAELGRLPWGATLVVVTAIVTPALVAELAHVRQAGKQTVLVTFGDASPAAMQGIVAYSIAGEMLMRGEPRTFP